jgi:hypothetical protein
MRVEERIIDKPDSGRNRIIQCGYPLLAVFIHFIVAILRCLYVVGGPLRLQGDEAQYWAWSKHLDLSYSSKPPLIAYCNYVTQWLFGHSELSVRANAILGGMLIGWVTYLFAYKIYLSHIKAFWASMLVLVMPFYFEVSLLYSTDSILLLFWLLSAYFYWQASETNKWQYWIAMGLCIGIGSLGKYAMLFFILTLFLYLLFEDRRKFSNPALYLSVLLSIAIFMPVIIWNINHQFIGYKHLEGLSGLCNIYHLMSWKISNVAIFIGGQIALISPLFIVMYFKMFKHYWHNKLTRYFFIPMFFILALFTFISIIKEHEADINWTMFVYTGFPILLASYIVDYHKEKLAKILFGITFSLLILATTIPMWSSPVSKRILPVRIDPIKKLANWKDMANAVDSVYATCGNLQKTFIFSDDYMLTSELLFYLYPNDHIYFLITDHECANISYGKVWNNIIIIGYDAIFIQYSKIDKKIFNPNLKPELSKNISSAFVKVTSYTKKICYYRNEPSYQLDIYKLKGFKSIKSTSDSYYQ